MFLFWNNLYYKIKDSPLCPLKHLSKLQKKNSLMSLVYLLSFLSLYSTLPSSGQLCYLLILLFLVWYNLLSGHYYSLIFSALTRSGLISSGIICSNQIWSALWSKLFSCLLCSPLVSFHSFYFADFFTYVQFLFVSLTPLYLSPDLPISYES